MPPPGSANHRAKTSSRRPASRCQGPIPGRAGSPRCSKGKCRCHRSRAGAQSNRTGSNSACHRLYGAQSPAGRCHGRARQCPNRDRTPINCCAAVCPANGRHPGQQPTNTVATPPRSGHESGSALYAAPAPPDLCGQTTTTRRPVAVKYMADQLTPEQYHAQRAAILAAP